MVSIKQQISEVIEQLSPEQQAKVLDFAKQFQRPRGESGKSLIDWVRRNPIDPQSLAEMEEAIKDCDGITVI